MTFGSTFKYATSDFTGISKSSSIKKTRLWLAFSKTLGLGNVGKVLSLVFELLHPIPEKVEFLLVGFTKRFLYYFKWG